jgi:glycine/D-amino acid oxidase-like deaminating enzyme
MHRVPNMNDIEVDHIVNAPEVFTPDTRMIMGESAEIDNYFIAGGLNGHNVSLAGGAGRYVAELIAFGETDVQLWPCDTRVIIIYNLCLKFFETFAVFLSVLLSFIVIKSFYVIV